MEMVKLVTFTEKDGKFNVRTDSYINPNASNEVLLEFDKKLNDLTDNRFGEAYRRENGSETDLTPITRQDMSSIIHGGHTPAPDVNPISRADIENIVNG